MVDTGVDPAHPDLAANLALVKDFVGGRSRPGDMAELHGTAIVGVIASTATMAVAWFPNVHDDGSGPGTPYSIEATWNAAKRAKRSGEIRDSFHWSGREPSL